MGGSIDSQKWNFWNIDVEPIPLIYKLTVFSAHHFDRGNRASEPCFSDGANPSITRLPDLLVIVI